MPVAKTSVTFPDDNWVRVFDAATEGGPIKTVKVAHLDDSAADVRIVVVPLHQSAPGAPAAGAEGYRLTLGARRETFIGVTDTGAASVISEVWVRREGAGSKVTVG